jgi:hypothetical protein
MKYYSQDQSPCSCFALSLFSPLSTLSFPTVVIKHSRGQWSSIFKHRQNNISSSSLKGQVFTAHLFMPRELTLTSGKQIIQCCKQRGPSLKLFSPESLTIVLQNVNERDFIFQHFIHSMFISLSSLTVILSRKDVSTNFLGVFIVGSIFLTVTLIMHSRQPSIIVSRIQHFVKVRPLVQWWSHQILKSSDLTAILTYSTILHDAHTPQSHLMTHFSKHIPILKGHVTVCYLNNGYHTAYASTIGPLSGEWAVQLVCRMQ